MYLIHVPDFNHCYAFYSVNTILNFVCLPVELNLSVWMKKYPLLSHVKLQFPQLCDGNNVIFFPRSLV